MISGRKIGGTDFLNDMPEETSPVKNRTSKQYYNIPRCIEPCSIGLWRHNRHYPGMDVSNHLCDDGENESRFGAFEKYGELQR